MIEPLLLIANDIIDVEMRTGGERAAKAGEYIILAIFAYIGYRLVVRKKKPQETEQ